MSSTTNIENTAVSVIVPVRNDAEHIALLIESLLKQDYPKDKYEIIVVDNDSKDRTREIIQQYPSVILLKEADFHSSYAARNKGIRRAKHPILAFIDSDCIASPRWLKEGLKALHEQQAQLVGGKIEFYFSARKTAAECYDSLIHFKFDETIQKRHLTGTSNLFARSRVFERIGLFPVVQSGGDFQWTAKAVQHGFRLVYCPDASVRHPTRKLEPLLKKHTRTGSGKPFIWKNSTGTFLRPSLFLSILPPNIFQLKQLIDRRGSDDMHKIILQLWAVKYLCKIYFFIGAIKSIVFIIFHRKKAQLMTMEALKQ